MATDISVVPHVDLHRVNPMQLRLTNPPKGEPQWHMHRNLELGIVLSGHIRSLHENCRLDIETGGIWFVGMYEPHGWQVMEENTRLVLMGFLPDVLMPCRFAEAPDVNLLAPFTVAPLSRPRTTSETKAAILAIAEELRLAVNTQTRKRGHATGGPMLEFAGKAAHDWLWLRAKLLELLAVIHRNWRTPTNVVDPPMSTIGCVNRALAKLFVEHRHITEQEAAKEAGVSVRTFTAMFQSVLGVSFATFSLRHRLESATTELVRTRHPIKTIALRWGFTDSSHFNHHFRKQHGCTPSAYRRQLRSGPPL